MNGGGSGGSGSNGGDRTTSSTPVATVVGIQTHSSKSLQKKLFIWSAIETGWTVHKRKSDGGRTESYVFQRKHNGNVKEYKKNYLDTFIAEHMSAASNTLSTPVSA